MCTHLHEHSPMWDTHPQQKSKERTFQILTVDSQLAVCKELKEGLTRGQMIMNAGKKKVQL